MVNNFTPIDVQKFGKNNNLINTILLLIATLTTFVLVILLFILIQKKIQAPIEPIQITPTPRATKPTPTLFVSPPVATSSPTPEATSSGIVCTQEVKTCPDGTSVGRTGPRCEFTPCPTKTATESSVVKP